MLVVDPVVQVGRWVRGELKRTSFVLLEKWMAERKHMRLYSADVLAEGLA